MARLRSDAPAITAQRAIGPQHVVTWNQPGDRVCAHGPTHGAARRRTGRSGARVADKSSSRCRRPRAGPATPSTGNCCRAPTASGVAVASGRDLPDRRSDLACGAIVLASTALRAMSRRNASQPSNSPSSSANARNAMPRSVAAMRAGPNGVVAVPKRIVRPRPRDLYSPGVTASSDMNRSCSRPGPERPASSAACSTERSSSSVCLCGGQRQVLQELLGRDAGPASKDAGRSGIRSSLRRRRCRRSDGWLRTLAAMNSIARAMRLKSFAADGRAAAGVVHGASIPMPRRAATRIVLSCRRAVRQTSGPWHGIESAS